VIDTILVLRCDHCMVATFSEATGPGAADLRRAAKRAGWRKRMRKAQWTSRSEDVVSIADDLCPDCVAKEADQ
jgi:hypothetical protein